MRYAAIGSLALAAALAASPALAQDDAPTAGWTGPYVGGSLGLAWQPNFDRETKERIVFDTNGDGVFGDTVRTAGGADAFSPGFCRGKSNGVTPSCRGDYDNHASWTVNAGYDMQMGSIVVGGVIEGGQSYISNTVSAFSTTPASYSMSRRLQWDAAARLRAGFLVTPTTLIYGTGGVAYGRFHNRFQTTNTFNTFTETNRREDDWGWVAGGGIEQKVSDNFSIGLLYKYKRFTPSDYRVTASQGTPPSATNPFVITPSGQTVFARTNTKFETNSVAVTANFRF